MNIVERVKSILLTPKPTWEVIDSEPADAAGLYTRYLMILAAIPAVCGFIGLSLIGMGGFGVSFRVPVMAGLGNMVVSYVLSLVGVYVLSLIINALATRFGGAASRIQALKVAVYSSTAAMLGGIFSLLPVLSILALLAGLYSIYLLHTGLPILMKSNREKSVAYTAVVIVAAIVLGLIMGSINALILPRGAGFLAASDDSAVTITTPGGKVVIDSTALADAQRKMEEAARQIEAASARSDTAGGASAAAATGMLGGGKVIEVKVLKTALPEQMGGLARTAYESQDGSAIGVSASQVIADYGTGERTVRLEISDLGGLGAMAAAAFGMVQGEKEDAQHAERTWQENGRTMHESYEKDGTSAERRIALKNGIIVTLTAQKTDIATLRSMVAQLDIAALERLQRPAS